MITPPLQIVLTGVTGYAKVYLNALHETPRNHGILKAVTAINRAENEAACLELENQGVEVFTDFSQMMTAWKNRAQLSILPVPIHLHMPMTLASQAAGMHVLLEKPLAGSVAQAQAICDADTPAHRIAIGFQDMYRPSTHRIAADLKQGRIGTITGIKMLTLWPRSQSYYDRNHWAGTVEINGQTVRDSPINNATAHFVNLALFFAGSAAGKMAKAEHLEAELFRARDIASFDTAAIRVSTNTGIPLHLYATHSCRDHETARVIVEGEKGSLTWIQGERVEWQVAGTIESTEIETASDTQQLMFQSVLQSLKDGTPFLCTPNMAMPHVALVEALHLHQKIKNFKPGLLVHEDREGDSAVYLPTLSADLKRCLAASALPSELGLDWAE